MSTSKNIAIIGGGVIGLCCAYYLNKEGHKVKIFDRLPEGDTEGCSFGNAGYICPSHFLPLAAPGMINMGLKWMLDAESPFYIKPRFNAELILWLFKFSKAATRARSEISIPTLRDMGIASRELFNEMEGKIDFKLHQKGLLIVCQTQQMMDEEGALAIRVREFGMEATVMDRDGIRKNTDLDIKAIGAIHYPMDAHMDPSEFMAAIRKHLITAGVEFVNSTEITSFEIENGSIKQVNTTSGDYIADEFVLSAGSWSGDLAKQLGLNMPIQAGKGYNLTVEGMGELISTPMILAERKVAITPIGSKLRFAGTMEIAGIDLSINPKRIDGILKSVKLYLPGIDIERIRSVKPWAGLRPVSPDGLPYVGRFTKYSNLIAANGHAMLGLSLSAITGKLVSQIVSDEDPSIDIALLSPDRYR